MPAGWVFAIWGLIFLSCVVFAIHHAWPSNLSDSLLRRVGWIAVLAFATNILWEYLVPKRGLDWWSVAIIIAELAILLTLVFVLLNAGPFGSTTAWLVAAPFLLYAGWTSAAVFVNLSSTARGEGLDPFGRGEAGNAVALILAATAIGATVAWFTGSWLYAAAVAWALVGIAVANSGAGGVRSVRWAAVLGVGIVLASGVFSPSHPWLPA